LHKFILLLSIWGYLSILLANDDLKITSNTFLDNSAPSIFKAIHNKQYIELSKLLKNGEDPCQELIYQYKYVANKATAFDYAIRTADIKIIKEFLPYIKNITKPTCLHKPSLFYAIMIDDIPMIKFLIDHGADINYISKFNTKNSAIEEALMLGKIRSAQFLIDQGVKISKESQFKALKHAVITLDIDTVRFLITQKIDLNYQDSNGNTILHIIAMGAIDNNLHALQQFSKSKYVKKIPGYSHSIEDNISQLKSKWDNYPTIIKLLVHNGVKMKIKNNNGKTAYNLAKDNNISTILHILKNTD